MINRVYVLNPKNKKGILKYFIKLNFSLNIINLTQK